MKPVAQSKRGGIEAAPHDRGDCFSACMASVLNLPLGDVPHFVAHQDWWDRIQAFLRPLGLALYNFENDGDATWCPEGYWLAGVPSLTLPPRDDGEPQLHAVVMRDGALAWDPNQFPDVCRYERVALDDVVSVKVFVSLDPSRAAR